MRFDKLEKCIHYTFSNTELLQNALTHRSFSNKNNERLEFLGDSILNFIIADQLYIRFAKLAEGDLSRLRAQLVKESTLAEIASSLEIGNLLYLGEGELKSAGWRRPSILADAFEAIVGAIYLDSSFIAAQNVVAQLFQEKLENINPKIIDKDAKSMLQEYLQSKKNELPNYEVVAIEGEAHAQTFKVQCTIPKFNIIMLGEGNSRRAAEQQAAERALAQLKL